MLTHEKVFVMSPAEGNILGSHLSIEAEWDQSISVPAQHSQE